MDLRQVVADSLATLPVVVVVAIVVVLALVILLVWLLTRDPNVAKTSFGFYIERDRYGELQTHELETRAWPSKPE